MCGQQTELDSVSHDNVDCFYAYRLLPVDITKRALFIISPEPRLFITVGGVGYVET